MSAVGGNGLTIQTRQTVAGTDDIRETVASNPSSTIYSDKHAWKAHTELVNGPISPRSIQNSTLLEGIGGKVGISVGARSDWTETDFPPLGDSKGERKADCGVWGERSTKTENEEAVMFVVSVPSWNALDALTSIFDLYSILRSPSPTLSPATPHMAAEQFGNLDETPETTPAYPDDDQEVDMPSTPGFGMSPITPKTPGSLFPTTPTSTSGDLQAISFKGYGSKENIPYYGDANRAERELDPTTLFVGGLEPFGPDAWDEAKVGNFFAKFGGLENVKVVRPCKCSDFFVVGRLK